MPGVVVPPYRLPVVPLRGCLGSRDPELPHVKAHGGLRDAQRASDHRLREPLGQKRCDGFAGIRSRMSAGVSRDDRAALHRAVPGAVRDTEPELALRRAMTKLVEAPDLVPIV